MELEMKDFVGILKEVLNSLSEEDLMLYVIGSAVTLAKIKQIKHIPYAEGSLSEEDFEGALQSCKISRKIACMVRDISLERN